MKKKLMILASALLLAGGYATYTAVQNSVLIQCVLAQSTEDMAEGEEGGGGNGDFPTAPCFTAINSSGNGKLIMCNNCRKVVKGEPVTAGIKCY